MYGLHGKWGRMKRLLAACAAGAALFCPPSAARAMDAILPLDEVRAGMRGALYTVVDASDEIRSFDVTILGVMRTGKSMPYILARSEGAFADTDGGLMQGMSGSPVYVDGRLIGAGSATLKEMDPHTFLITPIEEMLPLWDLPDAKRAARTNAVDLKARAKREADEAQKAAEKNAPPDGAADGETAESEGQKPEKRQEAEETAEAADAAETPADGEKPGKRQEAERAQAEAEAAAKDGALAEEEAEPKALFYASGFGARGMEFLQRKLAPLGCRAVEPGMTGGASYGTDYDAALYPGSAVGAALAYGDFAFAATGTVTAVEEDGRLLAFGHPFLHRGNVNYFMTDASVLAMVNGMSDGMKFANPGRVIGRISQDRAAGIAGRVGVFPSVVPIRLTVEDKSLGRKASYAASMAYDEAFVPVLTQAISYAALGRTVDSVSESTVKVRFAIRTGAVESGVFERTNLFYAAADTGQIAFAELAQALSLLAGDRKTEADVYDVKVEISSEAERRTASLVSAVPDKAKVKPGETVRFKVVLQPYRAEKVTLDVPFTVPKTQREGTLPLDVHGGGLVSLEKLLAAAQADAGVVTPDEQESLKTAADQLRELAEAGANHEIVIEPGTGPVLSEKEQKKQMKAILRRQEELQKEAGARGKAQEPAQPPRAKLATDYVIDNVIHAALEVSKKVE